MTAAQRIRAADTTTRAMITPGDILERVSLHDAKRVMLNFLLEKSGLPGSDARAKELARNDITGESLMRHFVECRALSTRDLPEIASTIISKIEIPNYEPVHRKITKFVKARDYKTATILANSDSLQFGGYSENSERQLSPITASAIELQIGEKPRGAVAVTRTQLLSGAANFVDLPRMLVNEAFRLEAQDVYATLEAGLLHDNSQAFTVSNSATGTSLADVAAALAKFRDSCDLEPRYFVVPSSAELTAHQTVFQAGLADKLSVIATSSVTASYLLADPQSWPVLVRLALTEQPLIESWPGEFSTDYVLRLTAMNDFAHAIVSSRGIVKLTSGT